MCGIVGYIGNKEAYPILIKGLKRLEYRGYDSAGIALLDEGELNVSKCKGKVSDLEAFIGEKDTSGSIGIGHTRWATHGQPNDTNAHPHVSGDGNITLIHNGIIENYDVIKENLISRGHKFTSDTDTEVLVHFIEEIHKQEKGDLFDAVRIALDEVHGAYAIVIIDKNNPREVIAAKNSSPLVIGIGENEYYLASDATPIVEYTKNVVYLEDGEIARVNLDTGLKLKTIKNEDKKPYIQELELQLEALEKGGYDHFMLKEIYEQPRSIRDCMRGRISSRKGEVMLGGIKDHVEQMANAQRIIIVACGTSW
ncbi:MAG TPA: glutamine--fructose-6-phosphate aminotransferase, partial [Flavobacteriales bacterium]|nr:glutamine--fructose-6-phosphate aminotransferase [Flavobacteriales bacterium]